MNTSISQINFFLSLVNAKRELFSPLVIVGSQIFERPSGGRYGGRWISDRYLKSNIYQIFGVQKSVWYETGSNPRPRITSGKPRQRQIPFDHRFFTSSLYKCNIAPSFGDLTNFVSTTPSSFSHCSVFKVLKLRHSKRYVSVKHTWISGHRWDIGKMKSPSNGTVN